jgi:8-oxo-dGTP pyrophosphatase MutT (NUDIX family)
MTGTSSNKQELIKAAGGLLWRKSRSGMEIAVVHRARYDDWTLPKGKLQEGESWAEAAAREVREETGYDCIPLGFAGAIAYQTGDGPKVVRFWHMVATGEPSDRIDSEVAAVFWFPIKEARTRVQYPLERALLEVWQGPRRIAP